MEDQRKPEGDANENTNNESQGNNSTEKDSEKKTDQIGIIMDSEEQEPNDEAADDQKPINRIEDEQNEKKTIKNLVSLVIILSGIAIGSIFVDVVQFVSGNGYSERALKDSEVFVAGDKTWVAYEDPAVEVKVLSVDDEELENCESCDPTEVLVWLKRFVPTLISIKVEASSEDGKALIETYGLKTIPSFVFSKEIQDSSFYQGEARVLFSEKNDNFVLNATGLGIPVGKYLETPEISESDAVLGNVEAPVKIVVFSDFQCPYCSKFYAQLREIVAQYSEDVALIYKDLPLDFHPQGLNAAHAVRCAGQQEMFWEMASQLYSTQDQWGKQEGKTPFITMATQLGLDKAQFSSCIEDEVFTEKIERDKEEAQNFGVSGTPATFINGQFFSGVVQTEELTQAIDKELEKK